MIGHTFTGTTQFLPSFKLHMRNSRIAFPACQIGDESFQTVRITNEGNTPLQFKFQKDPSGTFSVKPTGGLIKPGTLQLVCVCFKPLDARRYNSNIRCVFNNSVANSSNIRLTGQGSVPKVELDDRGHLFFKPTSIGLITRRLYRMRNKSRIPLRYRFILPHDALRGEALDPFHCLRYRDGLFPIADVALDNRTDVLSVSVGQNLQKGLRHLVLVELPRLV